MGQVWLSGQGHLLISDSQDRQIGFLEGQFVDEIPGAYGTVLPGGLGIPSEPIYTIPLTDTYTTVLDGQNNTITETLAVTQFGPGYSANIEGIELPPEANAQLVISPLGDRIAYQPVISDTITMEIASQQISENNQFLIQGVDIGAGEIVTMTVNVNDGLLVFNNSQTSGGVYDLEFNRLSSEGDQEFKYVGIPVAAGETHLFDYQNWDGAGAITLLIDEDSDGTIDETQVLPNLKYALYLPLSMH